MPGNLRKAHAALDVAVDKLYRPAPFASDRDRVEHLFGRYEALVNPLEREAAKQNKRVVRRAAQQDCSLHAPTQKTPLLRSQERRVGQEDVSTGTSREDQ